MSHFNNNKTIGEMQQSEIELSEKQLSHLYHYHYHHHYILMFVLLLVITYYNYYYYYFIITIISLKSYFILL